MKIKVTQTFKYSLDTLHVTSFGIGEEHDVHAQCAKYALSRGFAEEVKPILGRPPNPKGGAK